MRRGGESARRAGDGAVRVSAGSLRGWRCKGQGAATARRRRGAREARTGMYCKRDAVCESIPLANAASRRLGRFDDGHFRYVSFSFEYLLIHIATESETTVRRSRNRRCPRHPLRCQLVVASDAGRADQRASTRLDTPTRASRTCALDAAHTRAVARRALVRSSGVRARLRSSCPGGAVRRQPFEKRPCPAPRLGARGSWSLRPPSHDPRVFRRPRR